MTNGRRLVTLKGPTYGNRTDLVRDLRHLHHREELQKIYGATPEEDRIASAKREKDEIKRLERELEEKKKRLKEKTGDQP